MRCKRARNSIGSSTTIRRRNAGSAISKSKSTLAACRAVACEGGLNVCDSRVKKSTTMATETKPPYSPGLAGVVGGETPICWVDPNAGLAYRGYDIHEMAEKATFEEVAYLLLNGELPTADSLAKFTRDIGSERGLPGPVTEMLRLLPQRTHPMDMVRTGVSMLGPFDPELNDNSHDANIRKAIRLIARVSTLITAGWRISHKEDPLPEKPDLTQAGNFFYKLEGKVPQDWQIRMLDTIFNLYADHEFNPSPFAPRVTPRARAGISRR